MSNQSDKTKKCKKCNNFLLLERFSISLKSKDGLQHWCKNCYRQYDKIRYSSTKEKTRLRKKNKELKTRNKNFVRGFLLEHPCVDCGEPDPVVLDFDHIKGEKNFNISDGVRMMLSLNKLKKEMDKCVVRCANCHRRITHKRRIA